jgi:hypothetical protein
MFSEMAPDVVAPGREQVPGSDAELKMPVVVAASANNLWLVAMPRDMSLKFSLTSAVSGCMRRSCSRSKQKAGFRAAELINILLSVTFLA